LNSRNIVDQLGELCRHHLQLYGWFFPEPEQLYIVMERANENLLTALRRGMSRKKRMDVAVDVARGLEAIHKVGYVYQDVKPQNVMVL
jgi:serine/threonine protein kinase